MIKFLKDLLSVYKDTTNLKHIINPHYYVCKIAIDRDPYLIKYLSQSSFYEKLVLEALEQDPYLISDVLYKTEAICHKAIEKNGDLLGLIPKEFHTQKLYLKALKTASTRNGKLEIFQYFNYQLLTYSFYQEIIFKAPYTLGDFPEPFKNDEFLLKCAIKKHFYIYKQDFINPSYEISLFFLDCDEMDDGRFRYVKNIPESVKTSFESVRNYLINEINKQLIILENL